MFSCTLPSILTSTPTHLCLQYLWDPQRKRDLTYIHEKAVFVAAALPETSLSQPTPRPLVEVLSSTAGELLALLSLAQQPLKSPAESAICLIAGLTSAELGLHAGVQSPADHSARQCSQCGHQHQHVASCLDNCVCRQKRRLPLPRLCPNVF